MLITLIGCGKMGSAMLKGWLNDSNLEAEFVIVEPYLDALAWTNSYANVRLFEDCAAASAAIDRPSQMVVLAVKPQMMDRAIATLCGVANSDTAFLSIAAGIPTSWLAARLPKNSNGSNALVLRSMPNTPAAIGKGVTVLYAADAPTAISALATQLLSAVGAVVSIYDEELMDAVTAVSGSGPAYVFLLAETMTEAGIAAGLPAALAKQLVETTVAGAGELIVASDDSPSQLRSDVTSKGGTTAAALDVLMDDNGLATLMQRAIMAARDRSIELGCC